MKGGFLKERAECLMTSPASSFPLLHSALRSSAPFVSSPTTTAARRNRAWLVHCNLMGEGKTSSLRTDFSLYKWVKQNDGVSRLAPVLFGGTSFLLVLVNRTLSGIAPVADAGSAQSRADVIAVVLSATIILTGLVWISVKPRKLLPVKLKGIECLRMDESLPVNAASEVMWVWKAISGATCGRAVVIIYGGRCVLQAGLASENGESAKSVDVSLLMQGSLYQAVVNSGKQSYLANLSLYPARFELSFLPGNTQAVILQPLGDEGVMIVGGDTIRGFGSTDQVWFSSIGEKLDATLAKSEIQV